MLIAASSRARNVSKSQRQRRLDTRLSMYTTPPGQDLSLDDFESYAYDRLTVLKKIESLKDRGLKGEELRRALRTVIDKKLRLRHVGDERKDNVSHFILRLAYCRTEDLRRWFLDKECQLFRYRFEEESAEDVRTFMRKHDLAIDQITPEEHRQYHLQIEAASRSVNHGRGNGDMHCFKVPFEEALDMIKNRRVFVQGGFAFVPQRQLITLLTARFRTKLSQSLAQARKALPRVLMDGRVAPLLKSVTKQYLGKDHSVATVGTVTAKDVEGLSRQSMPLCMHNMHHELKRGHHLRHHGRMQYGLFLKGIGLSLDEALKFWRGEFTKGMSNEDFDKKYVYNIRHNYGKEGKRANYTPHSCMKIIMGPVPGPGDHHGCPFRHWDEAHLRARMGKLRVSRDDINFVVESVKSKDYQIACRKHFEMTHKNQTMGEVNSVGNHPNEWFDASRLYHQNKLLAEQPNNGQGQQNTPRTASSSAGATPRPVVF